MTFEQWKEIIPIICGQLTILAVQIIHAWHSSKRHHRLAEKVEKLNGGGEGK